MSSVLRSTFQKFVPKNSGFRVLGHFPWDSKSSSRFVHFDPTAQKKQRGTKYGGWYGATMIPGHGIGPELCQYVEDTFVVAGVPAVFERINVDTTRESNDELDEAMNSFRRHGCGIKANIETKSLKTEIISQNVYLRNELDLYVYVLHCYTVPGVRSRHKNVNIFVIRQNTEGEYSNMEHEVIPGVVDSLKLITRGNCERIARYAFDFAKQTGRKKITTIHKANIMKLSDGLFLEVSREIAKEYPDIQHDDMIIDNCCMQLVSNPHQFDMLIELLMPNLYGSIVTNVLCGLVGGPGLLSGCNYGDTCAVFEPGARNSGSGIAGKNMANPISLLNCGVDLLRYLGLNSHSKLIQAAIHHTLAVEKVHTKDLGGPATSKDMMDCIWSYIRSNPIQMFDRSQYQ